MSQKPQDIKIEAYNYDLPESKIPKYPLEQREQSKLLVYKNEAIHNELFCNIKKHLPSASFLIFNDSKVLPVRFHFTTSNDKPIEVFCLEPFEEVAEKNNTATWKCFVGNARQWKEKILTCKINDSKVSVELITKTKNYCVVQFSWNDAIHSMLEVFNLFGQIPIPPYLNRKSEAIDSIRYQNVFADKNGSVAAPTAGLHFTENIIKELQENDIDIDFVTLHVGAGTFKPVSTQTVGDHDMHMERMLVSSQLINNLIDKISNQQPITAVGTTSLRTLESLYWLGHKMCLNPALGADELKIGQWELYNKQAASTTIDSLRAIQKWMLTHNNQLLIFATEILIAPSYKFRIVDCLVTNFHQPKSTLLLLIAAAIGDDWKKIYDVALTNDYRFLSYGDSSLLHIPTNKKQR